MSNIIQFPVKEKTCGDCKIFEECYTKSCWIFGKQTETEKEASKNIPACEEFKK